LAERSPLASRDRSGESRFINPWNHRGWIDYFTRLLPRFQYIRFLGLPNLEETPDVPLDQLYVPLDLALTPVSPTEVKSAERRPAYEVLAEERWIVVLGDPGAGKSTLVNYLTTTFASRRSGGLLQALGQLIPVPIILRDYLIDKAVTFDGLLDQFILQPFWPDALKRDDLIGVLESGQALVMLDGLDEIGDVDRRQALRGAILEAAGMLRFPDCAWLLTSRIIGYDDVYFDFCNLQKKGAPNQEVFLSSQEAKRLSSQDMVEGCLAGIETAERFASIARSWYVCPFSSSQIHRYLENWYALREQDQARRALSIQSLMNAIETTPSIEVLAHNPNLLTMMALIHRVFAELPSGRALLYDKIAEAYLKSIDTFRGIHESTIDPRVQARWLGELAYDMQRERASDDRAKQGASAGSSEGEILVPAAQVEAKIREFLGPSHNATAELNYIGRRSGLLLPRKPGFYCFVHLSFQEYFAACHLLDRLMGFGSRRTEALDEVARLIDSNAWHETLIFLFEKLGVITDASDDVFQHCFKESRYTTQASALLAANLLGDLSSGLSQECRADAVRIILRHARRDASRSLINCINNLPVAIWSETFLPLLRTDLEQGSPPGAPFLVFLQNLSHLTCDQAETLLRPVLGSIPKSDLFYLHPLSGKGDGPVRQELSLRLPLRDWFRLVMTSSNNYRWVRTPSYLDFVHNYHFLPLFGFLDRDTTWLKVDRETILSWACTVHVLLQECLHAKLVLALAHPQTAWPLQLKAMPGIVHPETETAEHHDIFSVLRREVDPLVVGYAHEWMIKQRPDIGETADILKKLLQSRIITYKYKKSSVHRLGMSDSDFARFLLALEFRDSLHGAIAPYRLAEANVAARVAFGLMNGIDGIGPLAPKSTPRWAMPLEIVLDRLAELVLGRGGPESWRAIQQQVAVLKEPGWIGSAFPSVTEEEWGNLLELLGLRGKDGGGLFEAEWFANEHVFAGSLNARPSEFVSRLREIRESANLPEFVAVARKPGD
jgi:hypothetical protein